VTPLSHARLAALMTCHNRVAVTLKCLETLKAQKTGECKVDIFLVDDGSTDGTTNAVRSYYPEINIIAGDGGLYWCGGMHRAFGQAMEKGYDFYLWLNDDTTLDPDALSRLLNAYDLASNSHGKALIVVGSVRDPSTGEFSYGGWQRKTGLRLTTSWMRVPPEIDRPVFCDTMNGNCVLIPSEVVQRVGNLDPVFRHGMGDLDYGLRASAKGCKIMLAPGSFGHCLKNDGTGLWFDAQLSTLARWKKLLGPKGMPVMPWLIFTFRHKGPLWFFVWIAPYLQFWIRLIVAKVIRNQK